MVRPRFDRFPPPPLLADAVAEVDVYETGPSTHAVLPETGVVLGFQFRGSLSLVDPAPRALAPRGVTGLHEGPRVFRTTGPLGSVLVRLRPWASGALLRRPATEVTGWSLGLDDLFPSGSRADRGVVEALKRFADAWEGAGDDPGRWAAVHSLLNRVLVATEVDPLTRRAVELIDQRKGLVRVADLVDQLGTSHSPLLRRFHDQVGVGPKAYASLVRLRSLLPRLSSRTGALTDLAVELGFHDQAHFIAEFRRMTGLTPTQYQNKDRWTDSLLIWYP